MSRNDASRKSPARNGITLKDFNALSFDLVVAHHPEGSEEPAAARRWSARPAQDHVDPAMAHDGSAEPGWPAAAARLLIVDDVPTVRESLAKLLRSEGYEVEVARDGRDALDRFDPIRTRLVLLDLDMPSQHGWDVLEQLLALKPDQAVIIVTGKAEPCSWAAVGRPGILVEKPIDIPFLLNAIREALGESRKSRDERIAVQRALTRHTRPLASQADGKLTNYPRGRSPA
jgi:CheY-like chemotaxis protein